MMFLSVKQSEFNEEIKWYLKLYVQKTSIFVFYSMTKNSMAPEILGCRESRLLPWKKALKCILATRRSQPLLKETHVKTMQITRKFTYNTTN